MDLIGIEQRLRTLGIVLVPTRLLRHVLKVHRAAPAGLAPGHGYGIEREVLFGILGDRRNELGEGPLPEEVLLVPRLSDHDLEGRTRAETLARLWRSALGARLRLSYQGKLQELSDAALRQRIEAIGQTAFDEIRSLLRNDELLLPPYDDREVYAAFGALYGELRYYAPRLLSATFHNLHPFERLDELLAVDVEVTPWLEQGRDLGVAPLTEHKGANAWGRRGETPSVVLALRNFLRRGVGVSAHARLMRSAERAANRGNDVRAALQFARAATVADKVLRRRAERGVCERLRRLAQRLNAALDIKEDAASYKIEWETLRPLLRGRMTQRRFLSHSVELRLLYNLQQAALAEERAQSVIDPLGYVVSLGRRSLTRELPQTKRLVFARRIRDALSKVSHVRLEPAERQRLAKQLARVSQQADESCRNCLRPTLNSVLTEVGFEANDLSERLARDKLVEEVLDQALRYGFTSLTSLRDAFSRNQVKLSDLSDVDEWLSGDVLLRLDAQLAIRFEGIHRRGEVYLRGLQKMSSIPFGTRLGRMLTTYLALPLGASFVLLEGAGLLLSPLSSALGWGPIKLFRPFSFALLALFIAALLHSALVRTVSLRVASGMGTMVHWVLVRFPRFLLGRPSLRRLFRLASFRFFLRRLLIPALLAAFLWWLSPLATKPPWISAGFFVVVFTGLSALMGSALGALMEDVFFESLAPTWQAVRRRVLPELLRVIQRLFAAVMDVVQRAIYRVDEALRFRDNEHQLGFAVKAVFVVFWSVLSYVVRLYVTLLIEPEVNPLKHFPVVTVAHKLMLPLSPRLLAVLGSALSPLGPFFGGAIAGITVFLLPSVFGFLAWEFKENYKLYRATRPERQPAVLFGPDGETMRGLLVVGVHSGTVPKLYRRLRRAAQRHDEASLVPSALALFPRWRDEQRASDKFHEGLTKVQQAVARFVQRDLLAVVQSTPRWTLAEIRLQRVDVSAHAIRITLVSEGVTPCQITFEQHSGLIVAGVSQRGFLENLSGENDDATRIFENALAGFYQSAEVDLVREQIAEELGWHTQFDITDEGLLAWLGADYRTELLYRLEGSRRRLIVPTVRGEHPVVRPRPLDLRRIWFREQAISWLAWQAAWDAAVEAQLPLPRLLTGPSILPKA